LGGFLIAVGVLLALPAFSGADIVGDVVNQVGSGAPPAPGEPTGGDQSPRAGSPVDGGYTPPLHGKNPHGQGTAATIDINPSNTLPLGADPAGGPDPFTGENEEIVVGRSRGEAANCDANGNNCSGYHGHVVALALFGNELFGASSDPGQSNGGQFDQLNSGLGDICTGSGGQLCISVLSMSSTTNSSGSANSFQAASVHLGDAADGSGSANQINASAASSHGNISDDGTCQTSHGDSDLAQVDVGGDSGEGQLTADAISSHSNAQACSNGTSSQGNGSSLVNLQGSAIPIPDPACTDPNAVNVTPQINNPLLSFVCAAQENGTSSQAIAPYGVREALTAFVLSGMDMVAAKLTAAASETRAAAPSGGPPTPPGGDDDDDRACVGAECVNPDGEDDESPSGAAAGAGAGSGAGLPFTGANVLLIAMMGLGLLGTGLAIKAAIDGRRYN
jgi:hypothetical protein